MGDSSLAHPAPEPRAEIAVEDPFIATGRDQKPREWGVYCEGVVFVGHLVQGEDGEEVEVIDRVP